MLMARLVRRARKAYTLVELMVVLVAIGVLAAVGGVGYTSFLSHESEQTCLSQATNQAFLEKGLSFQQNRQPDYLSVQNNVNSTARQTGAWLAFITPDSLNPGASFEVSCSPPLN